MLRSRLRILVVAVLVLAGGIAAWQSRPRRTNLLIVTLDTTRADRLGPWGGPRGLTPMLDRLASQGIVFERAYAPAPLTLPSHVSLMTGRNPPEHGIRLNSGMDRLADDVPVLAEILKRQGYATGAFVGSFVLDSKFGLDRGFDVYNDEIRQDGGAAALDSHHHPMRLGEEVVDSALNWLFRRPNRPFFCWVHLFDPHTPYDARETLFGDRFRDRPYDAGIAYVDLHVGRLLQFVERQNLTETTLVVVLGDHGESLGEHQERTHGLTLYESTVHVPLIIRFPKRDSLVKRVSAPVSLVDVCPTLLTRLKVPFDRLGSGLSLLPRILDEQFAPRPIYLETDHPLAEGGWSPQRGLVFKNWKYIRSPRPELYDLAVDARELMNLAESRSADLENLEQLLSECEARFTHHAAVSTIASVEDQRKLASLGYLGGPSENQEQEESLADVKDMISLYNQFSDATVLFTQGRFEDARKILETVVQASPTYHQAWLYLGTSNLELGNLTEARRALERSVEIAGDPTARIVLGRFYLDQHQPELAIPQLEIAVRLRPQSLTGHFFLGESLRQAGRPEEAREHYMQVLELSPDFRPAQEAMNKLP